MWQRNHYIIFGKLLIEGIATKRKVIIVGAGPAGLAAANELAGHADVLIIEKGRDIGQRTCQVMKGRDCIYCNVCSVTAGVGGAGGMSDGKLNLSPLIGGDLVDFVGMKRAEELFEMVDAYFVKHGAPPEDPHVPPTPLVQRAAANGIEFIPIRQKHIGSDMLPKVIGSMKADLEKRGVRFLLETTVESVIAKNNKAIGVMAGGKRYMADFVLLAPGRSGSTWLGEQMKKFGVPIKYMPIDVGVRVEVPAVVYEEAVKTNWDPKFRMYTPTYDDLVRTFCTCPYGFVVQDTYESGVGVNGHSQRNCRSSNTNFAFLTKIALTEPLENTNEYGSTIAEQAKTIGGGKPLLQRLGDLKKGRRSTWDRLKRSYVDPTLKAVTPGDISMALPHRVVTDILEGLDMLDRVVPGVASDATLLYAPEIKFAAIRPETREDFEVAVVDNLYVAGDGAGVTRGIVPAAAMGISCAQGIIKKIKA
ncbi:NAD(P)/FAD-dependent oxidoreductase [Methanocella conradii]|uniref:NAD(P)/FAD-dependent oxidoreductase n=1 Tax=Methanocella conradii TaxID=1175444 RepID=UPI0024B3B8DC|nr:NAD(P)/FAD-dependent oxidoreductase [Methanocella conradii]MDI6896378.1 NAD(P)/FAD-dependent oxidoreductase [Methanocella conradii]